MSIGVTDVLQKLDAWEEALIWANTPNHWGVIQKARMQEVQKQKIQLQAVIRNLEVCARIKSSTAKGV